MSFPTSLIGDDYGKGLKWAGGALASDGCIYAAPSRASQILKINPENLTTELVGPILSGDRLKYNTCFGSPEDDSILYFLPYSADQIMKFNIKTHAVEYVGDKYLGDGKWIGGAIGNDGCIYCAPDRHSKILKFDPHDHSTTLVGDDLGGGEWKYVGAVASQDKASIYFIPFFSRSILEYHVATEQCTCIPIGHLVGHDQGTWAGGVLGDDGCIYGIPAWTRKILKYDPSIPINGPVSNPGVRRNPTLVGEDYGNDDFKWFGGYLATDGCIYGIPYSARKVLQYNTRTGTTALIGNDFRASSMKWVCGSLDRTGNIFAIPYRHNKVIRIQPSLLGMTVDQSGGIGDSPNNRIDRLGHEVYAKSLVDHIVGLDPSGEAVSVGLFSERGSGKSFFWNLIKKEFMDRTRQAPTQSDDDNATDRCSRWKIDESSPLFLLAVSLIVGWIVSALGFVLRIFCCSYQTGKWRIPDLPIHEIKDRTLYICVEFNSWTYQGSDNLWSSILEMLWTRVEEVIGAEKVKWHRAGIERADIKASDSQETARKKLQMATRTLQIQRNLVAALSAYVLIAFIALVLYLIWKQAEQLAKEENKSNGKSVPSLLALWLGIPALLGTFSALIFNLVRTTKEINNSGIKKITNMMKLSERKDFKQEKGQMGLVQQEVDYLFDFLKLHNARIVLFVDDLDRCKQSLATDALWAISLLFGPTVGSTDSPITSFLAVDVGIIVKHVQADFDGKENAFQHLEKIINLPFSIPPMNSEKRVDFCERALDNRELEVAQVYRKALFYKIRGVLQDFVGHIGDDIDALERTEEKDMLKSLLKVGQIMKSCSNENLIRIDDELLRESTVTEAQSKREKLLSILVKNFDILDENAGGNTDSNHKQEIKDSHKDTDNDEGKGTQLKNRKLRKQTKGGRKDKQKIKDSHKDKDNDKGKGKVKGTQLRNKKSRKQTKGRGKTTEKKMDKALAYKERVGRDGIIEQSFYRYKSMVCQEERKFIKKYAPFIDGVPRKIGRILNVYIISRDIASKEKAVVGSEFLEKLFVFTLLQELCPYRTSWLVFMSQCAEDRIPLFDSLLDDLKSEEIYNVQDLSLITVYERIVSGLLHCLPSAGTHLDADSGVMYYENLLRELKLGDLFSGCLRNYIFNLPQFMMTEIKMYRNHSIIEKRPDENYSWIAGFRRKPSLDDGVENEERVVKKVIQGLKPKFRSHQPEVTPITP